MAGLSVGIAGAGLLGRLLAWQLAHAGHRVAVFDPAVGPGPSFDGRQAAGFSAAGMLSPTAEMDNAGPEVAALGWRSIAIWRGICARLPVPPMFEQRGSLLLAHRTDFGAAQRVLARMAAAAKPPQALGAEQLAGLEPSVHGPSHAWLLPGEAQIDPVAALQALHADAVGVEWRWGCAARRVDGGRIELDSGPARRFDLVFDVRGTGARPAPGARSEEPGFTPQVRGVRGEIIWLHAPGHGLTRPLRLLHPRHRVYLVPRPDDTIVVGASEVESEDRGPVSLRSAVELMAAAHSVMPALAEARILRLDRNLRPALPDNEPHIEQRDGLVRINGLFRHGWLLAPALVEDAIGASVLAAPTVREEALA